MDTNHLLIYDHSRLCIPKGPLHTQILYDHHNAPIAGHQGITNLRSHPLTLLLAPHDNDVHNYVKSCDSCQQIKASQQVPAGLLQPMLTPAQPWESVSMDFIVQLPKTKTGYDAIVVFVDMFSKMVHFIPMKSNATTPDVAQLFFNHVFRLHGLPKVIVSDRNAKFTSKFWQSLFQPLVPNWPCLQLSTPDRWTNQTYKPDLEDMLQDSPTIVKTTGTPSLPC